MCRLKMCVWCVVAGLLTWAADAAPRAPEFVEGEAIVTFKRAADFDSARKVLPARGMTLSRHFAHLSARRQQNIGVIRMKGRTTAQLIAELQRDPAVESAEPNYLRRFSVRLPSDTLFPDLWAMQNTGQIVNGVPGTPGVDVKFLNAWSLARTPSTNYVVAVIDSGVDPIHPDLIANLWINPGENPTNGIDDDLNGYIDDVHGWDFANDVFDPFDSGYHGTHVAGTIAATGNNQAGVIGVDTQVKIMALKASEDGLSLSDVAIVGAIEYAITMKEKGINVVSINASFGGPGYDSAMLAAIQEAGEAGIIFCAAAGNDSSDIDFFPVFPASFHETNMIVVAATDQDDNLALFSNYGVGTVDVAAPGVNILSLLPMYLSNPTSYVQQSTSTYEAMPLTYSGMTTGITASIYDCGFGYPSNFPPEVSGYIALISRGDLLFNEKVANAMAAGAGAAVIYNNESGLFGGTMIYASNWIPTLAISDIDGSALLASLPAMGTVAYFGDPTNAYQFLEGTSMATPLVAGAVAFAAMNFPEETVPQRIERVLTNVDVLPGLEFTVRTSGRLNLQRMIDSDTNSLPDWWEQTYFAQLTGTLPSADPDNDGAHNLAEWLSGTNPTNSSSVLRLTVLGHTSNSIMVQWPSASGKFYRLEYATNLLTGFHGIVHTNIAATEPMNIDTDILIPASETRFYRVQVEP
jgi:subtilisin family serine protease